MPDTGKRYDLVINEIIDERAHLEKSTDAAIAYFTKLDNQFENWPLAAAAYNRGENGLARDMSSQSNLLGYWDLYLNSETTQYMYRILAIKYVMEQSSYDELHAEYSTYTRTIT